jgi:hypothetical protein
VSVPFDKHFHSRRLTIHPSQVRTAPMPGRSYTRRMELALFADPRYNALISGERPFDEIPALLPALATGELSGAVSAYR